MYYWYKFDVSAEYEENAQTDAISTANGAITFYAWYAADNSFP